MTPRVYEQDTISAIATGAGEGGIGIVRVSGENALDVAEALFVPNKGRVSTQKNSTVRFGRVVTREKGTLRTIDEALLLVMRGPRSYTGEDIVEIQAHGGPAVLREILSLTLQAGARLAQPGEFTKRAFLNGRLDLLQAEAVQDLIQAKTQRSLRWASAQLQGRLSRSLSAVKESLKGVLAHLEVAVDFPEDETNADTVKRVENKLTSIAGILEELLGGASLGFLNKRGLRVVLWGSPNVGKSSVLNRLSGHDRAIVAEHPGTTRDVVEEEVSLGGFPVRLLDTAGIQDTEHPVEKEGIARSRGEVERADLVLFILDASEPLREEHCRLYAELGDRPKLVVLNKSDLPRRLDPAALDRIAPNARVLSCSCLEEKGTQVLEEAIVRHMTQGLAAVSDEPVISTLRQRDWLEKTRASVDEASRACREGLSAEFVAADVRRALDALGALTGEVYTEDVLEVLFSKFCIGK